MENDPDNRGRPGRVQSVPAGLNVSYAGIPSTGKDRLEENEKQLTCGCFFLPNIANPTGRRI